MVHQIIHPLPSEVQEDHLRAVVHLLWRLWILSQPRDDVGHNRVHIRRDEIALRMPAVIHHSNLVHAQTAERDEQDYCSSEHRDDHHP